MAVIVVEITKSAPVSLIFWGLQFAGPFHSLAEPSQDVDRLDWFYVEAVFWNLSASLYFLSSLLVVVSSPVELSGVRPFRSRIRIIDARSGL